MRNQEMHKQFFSAWARGNALYAHLASRLGIGYPELTVLYALYTMEHLTQKEITEEFGLQKQTVNTVIRALKQEEYIVLEPDAQDKRQRLVRLTKQGAEYAKHKIEPLIAAETSVYAAIGEQRLAQAIETMELFNVLFAKKTEEIE